MAQSWGEATPKLKLVGLEKRYGKKLAVRCSSLAIERGEFFTLLGPSGSGKTTLLMMIAGFTQPTAGTIHVDGNDVTGLPPEKRNFGMMFQGYALFPHMTVAENIAFPLSVRRIPTIEIKRKVEQALLQVRLQSLGERLPSQLSGGQQQRVALARAAVFDPEILLLDEPLSALDRKLRGEMQTEIKHAHATLGKTFIYVTHDQDEALSLSDRIAILNDGEVAQLGSPEELYERPKSRFVASFLGESNFIVGEVVSRDGQGVQYRVKNQNFAHRGATANESSPTITLALRPERLSVVPQANVATGLNSTNGVIVSKSYHGESVSYIIRTETLGELAVHQPTWSSSGFADVGALTGIAWEPGATVSVEDPKSEH